MKQVSWLISRYLVSTIVPYFVFSWLLLSVILFVQQASRYADTFFSVNIPANLIWQLTIALVPNVIAFTCPMAMLVGTIIGLTKMQGDSEIVAIRAAGVGNMQIALPIMLLGAVMSIFAFFVNLEGVPMAASLVRGVALQTAITKLESPIEPGVFNSEVAGYTIYVKGGDFATSTWKNIFIYSEDKVSASVRLMTSRKGRIDTTGQASELVLENATVSTLPIEPGEGKYVSESIGEVRLAIKTKRSELIDKLSLSELRPEELGLQELSEYASTRDGGERIEAIILWQRRIILSITPLIFCLLGTAIVLRLNRGARGFGIAMALGVLIGFYLLTFLGEQLARLSVIGVFASSLIPIAGSLLFIVWFSLSKKFDFWSRPLSYLRINARRLRGSREKVQTRNIFGDLTAGLRDFDLISNLLKNFVLTLCFLSAIFIIFTAFELWKFAGSIDGGSLLLGKYLFYLLPFVYLQIAPSAAMIGTLATYVIKSRQNEIVTWTSAGQSVYRLLMPCFLIMILLGLANWFVQERILPQANQRQDATRLLIRNRGVPIEQTGKYWVANEKRIYSFEFASDNEKRQMALREGKGKSFKYVNGVTTDPNSSLLKRGLLNGEVRVDTNVRESSNGLENANLREHPLEIDTNEMIASDNKTDDVALRQRSNYHTASDNDMGVVSRPFGFIFTTILSTIQQSRASDNEKSLADCSAGCVKNLTIYEFADNGERLQFVYRADRAEWTTGKIRFIGTVERNDLMGGKISTTKVSGGELTETLNPFAELRTKPNHLNAVELKRQIETADSELDRRNLTVGYEKKYTTLFLPFVMALFTAPFSLSLSRKGKAAMVGYAIGLWLLFTGTNTVFTQLALNGMISPPLGVWSPLVIFSLLGVYLLSKVRT